MRTRFILACALILGALASPALASAQLVSLIYSANDFGEYRPCPT